MVVNAARVSFHKESTYEEKYRKSDNFPIGFGLKEADKKLLSYLAKNGHWTPFSHPQICLRVKAPIFVARQLFKHKVGMTENEVSRRYVDDTPEFYIPQSWRGRPTNGAKQGSSDAIVELDFNVQHFFDHCQDYYQMLLDRGVAPEQARMVLPQSMYTEWYWTGSLSAYARICKLRLDAHAQAETREIAETINEIVSPLFPHSWQALVSGE